MTGSALSNTAQEHQRTKLLRFGDRRVVCPRNDLQRPLQVRGDVALYQSKRDAEPQDLVAHLPNPVCRVNRTARFNALHHGQDIARAYA